MLTNISQGWTLTIKKQYIIYKHVRSMRIARDLKLLYKDI